MLTSLETATISPPTPPPPPPPTNNGNNNSSGKKPAPAALSDHPPPPALRCPRCDSANTKFCYYNNYSLSQPRHFCKTCRRYWTKGGALRNVPIGGGCRKSKKSRSSAARLPPFTGISAPTVDFSLASFPPSGLYPPNINLSNLSQPCGPVDVRPTAAAGTNFLDSRFSHPFAASGFLGGGGTSVGETGGLVGSTVATTNGSGSDSSFLAASIESLSSLNQELHWKLQQQRLTSMLYDGGSGGGEGSAGGLEAAAKKPQPIFFQNLDVANSTKPQYDDQRASIIGTNQWFFDSSFGGAGGPTGGGSNDGDNENGVSGGWSHQIPPVCPTGWYEKGFK